MTPKERQAMRERWPDSGPLITCLDALEVAVKRIAELETMVQERADDVAGWASVNLRNELRISELEAELD